MSWQKKFVNFGNPAAISFPFFNKFLLFEGSCLDLEEAQVYLDGELLCNGGQVVLRPAEVKNLRCFQLVSSSLGSVWDDKRFELSQSAKTSFKMI